MVYLRVVFIYVLGMSYDNPGSSCVGNVISSNLTIPYVIFQMGAQITGMTDLSIQNPDVFGGIDMDRRRRHIVGTIDVVMLVYVGKFGKYDGALHRSIAVGSLQLIQIPVRVGKSQSVKGNILHVIGGRLIPTHFDDRIRLWNDHFCAVDIFSLSWYVIKHASRLVKIKLTGFLQPFKYIGHIIGFGGTVFCVPSQILCQRAIRHLQIHLSISLFRERK